jgi:hypothetical protein
MVSLLGRWEELARLACRSERTVGLTPVPPRRTVNWELTVKDTNSSQHYTYYLSICGPLVNSSAVAGCLAKDPASQACQVSLTLF